MSITGNNIEKLLAVLASPFQSVEGCLQQLLSERSVDTAVGAQLDVLGKIVGQSRGGLDDDHYRRYIRARISANRSTGIIEDLLKVTDLIVYDNGATYITNQEGTATLRLRIADVVIDSDLAEVVFEFAQDTVSAGVRIVVQWGESPTNELFTLDIGPGLDSGKLAGALG